MALTDKTTIKNIMTQYPLWKHLLLAFTLITATLYTLPNFYPDEPAIQISSVVAGGLVPSDVVEQVEQALAEAGVAAKPAEYQELTALIRIGDLNAQLQAQSIAEQTISRDYVVALNLAPTTPQWLENIGGKPMKLGLDLRGGVHFLLQVELEKAVDQREQAAMAQMRTTLKAEMGKSQRPDSIVRKAGDGIWLRFANEEALAAGRTVLAKNFRDFKIDTRENVDGLWLRLTYSEQALRDIQNYAIDQNRTALSNRINELGVAEPVIQRQGLNRIVVELPGVQDTAEAKRIIGKTASLEFRMVNDDVSARYLRLDRAPPGSEIYPFKGETRPPVIVKKRNIITGDNVVGAQSGFDQNGQSQVSIKLDSQGGKKMQRTTSKSLQKPMAVLFIEQKTEPVYVEQADGSLVKEYKQTLIKEVINVATIQGVFSNSFQITGLDSPMEAAELALLLRSGALAAPMYIVEERTIGPSLGAENIQAGLNSVLIGMTAVLLLMVLYYKGFGMIANVALIANLVIIVAIMSLLQATLTLPGIAGIVLTVGMAVDANVLIFARIREELGKGMRPGMAIDEGYKNAFSTILDANITTLLVALVLLAMGAGSVKGFAVTLFIGILTSMFTAVMGTRSLVSIFYGGQRLSGLRI